MKHFYITIPGLLAVLALAACSWIAGPDIEKTVSIDAQDSTLVITNESDVTVYYWTIERETMNYVDWVPCDDPDECRDIAIEPGSFKEIPYADIQGWSSGATVVVTLWYLKRAFFTESGYEIAGGKSVEIVTPN